MTGGTDATRVVLGPSPTWICAPHISEESTRKKERDPKRWAREYACQFQGGISSAIDVDGLAACVRPLPGSAEPIAGAELVLDASGGRFDAFTAWLFQWIRVPESGPWHLMKYAVDDEGNRIAVTPERDARRASSFRIRPTGSQARRSCMRGAFFTSAGAFARATRPTTSRGCLRTRPARKACTSRTAINSLHGRGRATSGATAFATSRTIGTTHRRAKRSFAFDK